MLRNFLDSSGQAGYENGHSPLKISKSTVHTVTNPGLVDRADSNPERVYRIMTPSIHGQRTEYKAVSGSSVGGVIPNVTPLVPNGWAPNSRVLGVTPSEVNPQNPVPNMNIIPGLPGQDGAGMSVIPVMDLALFPNHRVPKRNNGTGSNADCWFFLNRVVVEASNDMRLHFDMGNAAQKIEHGVIEPAAAMSAQAFISALGTTANQWVCLDR